MRKTNRYCFFYRSVLGQWHKFNFMADGIAFNCNEQYMMFHKAVLFGDAETASKIMLEKRSKEQQALGRIVKNYKQDVWDANKYEIVKSGNMHRFRQDEESRIVLFSTSPLTLVEASPVDGVWGIKLGENDTRADDARNWNGENLLGKALTEVRDTLMKEDGLL